MTAPDAERLREALVDLERGRLRERDLRHASEALLAGLDAVTRAPDEERALGDLLAILRWTLAFREAFVLTGGDDGPLAPCLSTAPQFEGATWAPGAFLRRVLSGQPSAVFDVARVPEWQAQPAALRDGVASALHVPLRPAARSGVLVATHPERGYFTAQHVQLARRLAPLVAQALVQRDLRRAAVERDRFFALSGDMIAILGFDGRFRQANPAWRRTLGRSPEELVGQSLESRVHADDRGALAAALGRAAARGEATTCEVRLLDASGGHRWVQWSTTPFPAESVFYGVARDVTERKEAEERVRHLALHDALTGLPNRVLLRDRARQGIALAERGAGRLGVLFVDLDGFKGVNDTLGHEAGDVLLRAVAARLRRCCQRSADTVARVGGDEFIVLLPGLGDLADAVGVATCVVQALALPFPLGEEATARIGASVGVSAWPEHGGNLDALVRAADEAMYQAKLAGGGRARVAAPATAPAEAHPGQRRRARADTAGLPALGRPWDAGASTEEALRAPG
jgi:diguanylate cyclase (GGDEF)-like protein/PAS domain S-box-containing protein